MTAEFCALSEATGLDTQFWAGRLGVPENEITRWQTTTAAPPRAVIDLLDHVLTWQTQKLDLLEQTARSGHRIHLLRFPDELDFIATYSDQLPWKAHERLIALAYARLRALQLPAVLHDFNAEAFHQWRDNTPDTPELRARWLSSLSDVAQDLATADRLISEAMQEIPPDYS